MLTHIYINALCALNDHFRLNTNLKKKNVQLNIYECKKKSFHLKTLKYLCFLNLFLTLSTHFQSNITNLIKKTNAKFPGSPVVRTQCFHCWGPGSIPGWGTKIPEAVLHAAKKKKKRKEKQLLV